MANNRHWKGAHEISGDHEVSQEITENEDIDEELGEAYPVPSRPYIVPDSVKSITAQPRKRAKLQDVTEEASSLCNVDSWDAPVEASTSKKGKKHSSYKMEEPDLSGDEITCLDDCVDVQTASGGFVVNGMLEPDEDQLSNTWSMEVDPEAAVGPSCHRESDDESDPVALSSDNEANYETFQDEEIAVVKVQQKSRSRILSPMTPDNMVEQFTDRNNIADESVCVERTVKDQGLVPKVFEGYVKEFIDDRPNKLGILFSRECGKFRIHGLQYRVFVLI